MLNTRLSKVFRDSDNRYLNAEERGLLASYAESVPERLRTAELVEKVEQEVCKTMVDEMRRKYPRFETHHENAWGKAFRDVQLTIRNGVHAMLLDDVKMLEDKLLVWFRTILASFDFTPQFNRDCYTIVRDAFRRRLPAESYSLMEPYLQRCIDVMSDFPAPANPRV